MYSINIGCWRGEIGKQPEVGNLVLTLNEDATDGSVAFIEIPMLSEKYIAINPKELKWAIESLGEVHYIKE